MGNLQKQMQRLENYLASKEETNFSSYQKHPVRWIILESIIVPTVGLGVNIIGSDSGLYFVAGITVIIATRLNSTLKAQNTPMKHKIIALLSLSIATILGGIIATL